MGEKLTFEYDREGDVLHISRRAPDPEQESQELEDGIVVRLNPKTGEVENREVLFCSTRLMRSHLFELPSAIDLTRAV